MAASNSSVQISPKFRRYAERLRVLIGEGRAIASNAMGHFQNERYVSAEQSPDLYAWITKTDNIVRSVFGEQSTHYIHISRLLYDQHGRCPEGVNEILRVVGVLQGALSDLEDGFLTKQEFVISAALFDGLLEQAKHLCKAGYKDAAAVLGRVVIEDALRGIARQANIDDIRKAAVINDALKTAGRYTQPQWRHVQAWLDIGNSAAHGNFSDFTEVQTAGMLDGIESFLANEYKP
jgi:hypothetical protein